MAEGGRNARPVRGECPLKTEDITVTKRYRLGHCCTQTFETTALHCPRCGAASVWVETGPGDYYQGPKHICIACGGAFYVHLSDESSGETVTAQAVEQIKDAVRERTP